MGAGNPNTDYSEWPVSQGAPTDGQGQPLILGRQTLWTVCNDANPLSHSLIAGSSQPLGVEVRQLIWAYDDTERDKIIYFEYRLYNKGANDISDFYISFWLDPDLGNPEDDLTGCDTLSDIYYCYNANDSDAVYGNPAPAIGTKLVYGPVVPSPGDTAIFFRTKKPGFRNLGMSSFISYPNGDDPQSAQESYNIMQGLNRNGTPLANGTRFNYPGDPVAGTGDTQVVADNPHFLRSFGPIDFPSGDSQYVFLKLGIGEGTSRLNSITNLKALLNNPDTLVTDFNEMSVGRLPESFVLNQNYPNPFNPATTIRFEIPGRSHVEIVVYNLLGQKMMKLLDEVMSAGEHQVTWDGTDSDGRAMPSGIYFYQFKAGDYCEARKVILLR